MRITSIDNMYEDDGMVQAQALLASFNRPNLDGTSRTATSGDRLTVIVPEYREDGPLAGKLNRLNFVTRPAAGQDQHIDKLYEQLEAATAAVITERQRQHDAALAQLDAETITVTKET